MKSIQNVYCMVSVSTLPLPFKRLLLNEFWCSSKEYPHFSEMATKILLSCNVISVRQDFLHGPQPKSSQCRSRDDNLAVIH